MTAIVIFMINHCFCNIIYGATFDSYGPFVPYLSEATGLPESSFTIIFTMRGIGYILAGILKLKLMKNIDLHRALGISCISAGLSSMLFFTNLHLIWLGLFSLCLSVFACFFDIFSNIAVLQCGKNREAFYLGIAFTFQSVGNGLGPFLVSLIGLKAYSITGFCFLIGGIIYMIFPKFAQKILQNQQEENKKLSKKLEILFCLIMAGYAAFCLTYRSWFATFSVISGYQTKEQASLINTLMATTQLISRLIFLCLAFKPLNLLRTCTQGMILYGFIMFMLFFLKFDMFLVYSSAIIYAILICQYFPYLLSVPSEFGLTLTSNNSSKMMTSYALSESLLTFFVGYLMEKTHPMAMFAYMILIAIAMNGLLGKTVTEISFVSNKTKQTELQQLHNPELRSQLISK